MENTPKTKPLSQLKLILVAVLALIDEGNGLIST